MTSNDRQSRDTFMWGIAVACGIMGILLLVGSAAWVYYVKVKLPQNFRVFSCANSARDALLEYFKENHAAPKSWEELSPYLKQTHPGYRCSSVSEVQEVLEIQFAAFTDDLCADSKSAVAIIVPRRDPNLANIEIEKINNEVRSVFCGWTN